MSHFETEADIAAELAHDAAEFVASRRGTKKGMGGQTPEAYERRYSRCILAALAAAKATGDYEAAKRAARKALRG